MQFSQLFVLGKNIPESQILCPFTKYKFGDFFVTPIPLSHDAINTTGYIIEDKNGHIWVSTINGLSRIDSDTDEIKNYCSDKNNGNLYILLVKIMCR